MSGTVSKQSKCDRSNKTQEKKCEERERVRKNNAAIPIFRSNFGAIGSKRAFGIHFTVFRT